MGSGGFAGGLRWEGGLIDSSFNFGAGVDDRRCVAGPPDGRLRGGPRRVGICSGRHGANFVYGDPDNTSGEAVTATAGSLQPVTDPYNSAYAIGGNGGQGVSDLIGQSGGWGGYASATAATTVIFGSAKADATAVGGAFGGGGYGISGGAFAVANAAAAGGGTAVATAVATGGQCNGPCQPSNSGYATSNAKNRETAPWRMRSR